MTAPMKYINSPPRGEFLKNTREENHYGNISVTVTTMTYEEFSKTVILSIEDICRDICREQRYSIKIKNEEVAIKNLVIIFNATLELSNRKGFQAMSLRDLSKKTGLSLGALYAYFSSKEELLDIILSQGWRIFDKTLTRQIAAETDTQERLRTAIRTHLFLSEMLQPWFYFSYMEAKNLPKEQIKKIIRGELFTEKILADILEDGVNKNIFTIKKNDLMLTASLIKAIQQDWYLKRWKYSRRGDTIDAYARFAIESIERLIVSGPR
jgi:TetR/AcrR family transcriptional regulator, cholesterol catabolism regulator